MTKRLAAAAPGVDGDGPPGKEGPSPTMSLGEAAGKVSGWLDNTASPAVNRDPRDGLLDVFAEEDYLQRILWYRVDDRAVTTITGPLRWRPPEPTPPS